MGATSNDGTPAFPDMGPNGGTIFSIPVIASDFIGTGMVVLCDATGVDAGTEAIELDIFSQADLQIDTSPDSPPGPATVLQNLWQLNLRALLAERRFGARKVRTSCVAAVQNLNSYVGGFSPP
jgi:hypothetical protein